MEKILITGSNGFVGSFLVEEALKRNLEVYAGLRKTSNRRFLKDRSIHFFEMDFSNPSLLRKQLQKQDFDYVIHNAGVTKADKKADFFKYNYELTKSFAGILQTVQPSLKKFSYVSSLASYGPADNQPGEFVRETDIPRPIDTYGESKLASEQWLQSQSNFPYLIFRPTAVYGPRETEIFTFFKAFSKGIEGYIGQGGQKATFIYVKDLARLLLDATLSDKKQKAYFVADGNSYPTQDLGRISRKILNKKPLLRINIPIALVKLIAVCGEGFGRLSGKVPALNLEKVNILKSKNWQCDIAALKNDFNFAAAYDLEKGLRETIQWYQENGWL